LLHRPVFLIHKRKITKNIRNNQKFSHLFNEITLLALFANLRLPVPVFL